MSEITVENITPETYTDDFVVDCARVSYAKRADQFTPEQNEKLIRYLFNPPDSVPHWAPFAGPRIGFVISITPSEWAEFTLTANLRGFAWKTNHSIAPVYEKIELNGSLWAWYENLKYLPKRHSDAIEHTIIETFPVCARVFGWKGNDAQTKRMSVTKIPQIQVSNLRIKAPVFVARQLVKHQVDLVWSESSRRYLKDAPELWWPKEWHKAPTHSKQGASDELFEFTQELTCEANPDDPEQGFKDYAQDQVVLYNLAIEAGMAPEEARMILPQNMMTEWIWTGTHDAFRRVLRERLAPGAQKSGTRETAEKIKQALNW